MTKQQDVQTLLATHSDNGSTTERQCRLQLRSTMSFVLCIILSICCLLSQEGVGIVSAFNMPTSSSSTIRSTSTSIAVPTLSLLQITGGYQKQTMNTMTVRKQQQQQHQQIVPSSQLSQSSVRIMERDSTATIVSRIVQSVKVRTIITNAIQVSIVALVLAATVATFRSSSASTITVILGSITSALTVAGTSIDTFWRNFPYIAAGLTCGFKATAADIVAQRRQQKQQQQNAATATTTAVAGTDQNQQQIQNSKKIDWKRTTAYLLYGVFYQGMTQEHVYNHLYPIWFGINTNIQTAFIKVLFDVTIQTIFFTLPFAYLAKACIYQINIRTIMKQYIDDIIHEKLLLKYISLWAPVNMLTFSIVPVHYRVTWIACISFIWMIILSSIASRQRPATVE